MEGNLTAICVECGCKTAYTLKTTLEELTIHGVTFKYAEHSSYCSQCGKEVYVGEINDENVRSREGGYHLYKRHFPHNSYAIT